METPQMKELVSNIPPFYERLVEPTDPLGCIDGRPDKDQRSIGIQMLGGTLNMVVLRALAQGRDLDESLINEVVAELRNVDSTGAALPVGVHKGHCGFAHELINIMATIVEREDELNARVSQFVKAHEQEFLDFGFDNHENQIQAAFESIRRFSGEKQILVIGEDLVDSVTTDPDQVTDLLGKHEEVAAFVNLKDGYSLDNNLANGIISPDLIRLEGAIIEKSPAFNLDMWAVRRQARALGINQNFAVAASLVLYAATEMVLVEQSGKPALPMILHT